MHCEYSVVIPRICQYNVVHCHTLVGYSVICPIASGIMQVTTKVVMIHVRLQDFQ